MVQENIRGHYFIYSYNAVLTHKTEFQGLHNDN